MMTVVSYHRIWEDYCEILAYIDVFGMMYFPIPSSQRILDGSEDKFYRRSELVCGFVVYMWCICMMLCVCRYSFFGEPT